MQLDNNTSSMKSILMDELNSLISGKTTIERANAVSKLSAQAIYATRLEIENKRIEVDIKKSFGDDRWNLIDNFEVSVPSIKNGGKK
jgi:hypothetical protein